MTWTYDLSTAVGEVRFLIGDTDEDTAEFTNEELTYLLGKRGNHIKWTAYDACMQLARKYAGDYTFSADGVSVSLNERSQRYADMAKELRKSLGGGVGTMTLSRADGYSDAAGDSEYQSRITYVRTS